MTTVTNLNTERFSAAPYKKCKKMRFTVLSAEDLEKWSVCEVCEPLTYMNGKPTRGGVNDPRMGPIDRDAKCETCGENLMGCPGHFGHIKLAEPMYSWGFMKTALQCIRSVCFYCSRLLIDPDDPKMQEAMQIKNPKARLKVVANICRGKARCNMKEMPKDTEEIPVDENGQPKILGGCGMMQPTYKQEATEIFVTFPEDETNPQQGEGDRRKPLTGKMAHQILSRITEEQKRVMGFLPHLGKSDPSWLVLTHFPVPPNAIRPTVSFGTDRSEDDLTVKLLDLLKANKTLKEQLAAGASSYVTTEFANLLQYHVFTLCDNNINNIPQATTKSKKPIKSVRERLKGKEGRLRGHLMGKRVDFSARTVIGGDPMLDIDQVGVPKSIASNLTFPEHVNALTIKKLEQMVANGPSEWPGAKVLIKKDGTRLDLRYTKDDAVLEFGDIVERHMVDDDYVVFNRQPSLHKMSMMGHRAKILPWSTFRLNLSATSPYNADFDGDEMNLHLAQSQETRAEIKHIMLVPKQMVSPQGNKPVMGVVQDSLLAVSKFTKRDTLMRKDMVFDLLLRLPEWDGVVPTPCILKPEQMWSGKQIVSMLFPTKLQRNAESIISGKLRNDPKKFPMHDHFVVIQDGELMQGIIDKKAVGSAGNGLIHLMWLDHGAEACKILISYIQKLVNQWLLHHSFTTGCQDIVANEDTMTRVAICLRDACNGVRNDMIAAQRGKLQTQPGKTMYQSFEAQVNQSLNKAREDAGKIGAEQLNDSNNIVAMVQSGSKGSPLNIAQIIACVGQQNVEGKRISNGFRDRTLPHFTKDDYGPESRGFVENSYLSGLTPQELYFHAMGGREGVIDTACKTSETGYIQRRLVKSMETLRVRYDGTVRNDTEDVVQFLYGEDGFDGVWVEDQNLDLITMDWDALDKNYRHDYESESYGVGWIEPKWLARFKNGEEAGARATLDEEFLRLKTAKTRFCQEIFLDGDAKQHIPVNVPRMIKSAQFSARTMSRREREDKYDPITLIKKVEQVLEDLQPLKGLRGEGDVIGLEVVNNAMIVMRAHLASQLASKKLLKKDKLSKLSVDWLLGEIKSKYERALAMAGEMVGTLAAQSVGEPATQMTLNTFHFAGVGSKNVTLGVPRLREIINVAKTVKTPSLTVYLRDDIRENQILAKNVQTNIEYTTLERVASFTQIFYDPEIWTTIVPEDRDWVEEYYELPDEEDNRNRVSPWVLRIQLDNKIMTDKKLSIRQVTDKIVASFSGDVDCISTDDNAADLVLRLRILQDANAANGQYDELAGVDDGAASGDNDLQMLRNIERNILREMKLKGIFGIKKVFMREEKTREYSAETGKFEAKKEWVLDTEGCNLEEVLQQEQVDHRRTTSNDVVEIMQALGVEATRKSLLEEVRKVISFDGSYVNYRHLSILCDTMSNRGHLMAISRHGVNRADHGPLMKCSFEETAEMLMEAAMYGQEDNLLGVSEGIILGQLANIGTNEFQIMLDDERDEHQESALGKAKPFFEEIKDEDEEEDMDMIENGPGSLMTPNSPYTLFDDAQQKRKAALRARKAEKRKGATGIAQTPYYMGIQDKRDQDLNKGPLPFGNAFQEPVEKISTVVYDGQEPLPPSTPNQDEAGSPGSFGLLESARELQTPRSAGMLTDAGMSVDTPHSIDAGSAASPASWQKDVRKGAIRQVHGITVVPKPDELLGNKKGATSKSLMAPGNNMAVGGAPSSFGNSSPNSIPGAGRSMARYQGSKSPKRHMPSAAQSPAYREEYSPAAMQEIGKSPVYQPENVAGSAGDFMPASGSQVPPVPTRGPGVTASSSRGGLTAGLGHTVSAMSGTAGTQRSGVEAPYGGVVVTGRPGQSAASSRLPGTGGGSMAGSAGYEIGGSRNNMAGTRGSERERSPRRQPVDDSALMPATQQAYTASALEQYTPSAMEPSVRPGEGTATGRVHASTTNMQDPTPLEYSAVPQDHSVVAPDYSAHGVGAQDPVNIEDVEQDEYSESAASDRQQQDGGGGYR